jgi:hypothetical protein
MATQQLHSSMASRPSDAAELQLRPAATAPRIPCARAQAPFLLPLPGAQQHPCAAPLLHFPPHLPHQTAPAASRRRPWPSPLPPWPPSSLSRAPRKFQQRAPPPICAAACSFASRVECSTNRHSEPRPPASLWSSMRDDAFVFTPHVQQPRRRFDMVS